MMPTVRISDETWEKLKKLAIPLEDTADDAIRKAVDIALAQQSAGRLDHGQTIAGKSTHSGGSIKKKILPQKEFHAPLLETLSELGGRAETNKVRPIMGEKIKDRLYEDDYRLVKTGEPRWWNAICWARNDLVKDGRMRNDSPRGIWELSEKGVKFVETKLR